MDDGWRDLMCPAPKKRIREISCGSDQCEIKREGEGEEEGGDD